MPGEAEASAIVASERGDSVGLVAEAAQVLITRLFSRPVNVVVEWHPLAARGSNGADALIMLDEATTQAALGWSSVGLLLISAALARYGLSISVLGCEGQLITAVPGLATGG